MEVSHTIIGTVTRLLILTGARREEITQLTWSEAGDLDAIRLEGSRTKTGAPHIIPLSAPARGLLDSVPRIAGSDFVFTTSGKKPIAGWSRAKILLDAGSGVTGWRIHDLRRTAATGMQKLGITLQVVESLVLGHTSGSRGGIVGVYQRHDYAKEKRGALEAWGAHVVALVEGQTPGKVVAFGGRRLATQKLWWAPGRSRPQAYAHSDGGVASLGEAATGVPGLPR